MTKYRKFDTHTNKYRQSITDDNFVCRIKTNKYIHSITVNDVWLQCYETKFHNIDDVNLHDNILSFRSTVNNGNKTYFTIPLPQEVIDYLADNL